MGYQIKSINMYIFFAYYIRESFQISCFSFNGDRKLDDVHIINQYSTFNYVKDNMSVLYIFTRNDDDDPIG